MIQCSEAHNLEYARFLFPLDQSENVVDDQDEEPRIIEINIQEKNDHEKDESNDDIVKQTENM